MTTTTTTQLSNAEQNARGHVETIATAYEVHQFCIEEGEGRFLSREAKAMLRELDYDDTNHDQVAEAIKQQAQERPLSVDVRSGWHAPELHAEPEEFQILLSTGGPALRIVGSLDACLEPQRVTLQHQDWGTPWTEVECSDDEQEALEWFAGLFWFGEA